MVHAPAPRASRRHIAGKLARDGSERRLGPRLLRARGRFGVRQLWYRAPAD
ncbi:MAG: hypothetical protein JWO90_189, partial [Solirubrobacterales bacterium]|nr:hypothetical protein [Solirubrobacterales bacterium]